MRRCFVVLAVCLWSSFAGPAQTFTNPIVASGADPWIVFKDGYYYLTYTTGTSVQIHHATRLTGTNGIGRAPVSTFFTPPPPFNQDVWAPELHFLNGHAYIYYAADDGNNADHRMFAAESVTNGPGFSFTAKGKVYDPTTDRWAIDGTVLEGDKGDLYFIWSGWPADQNGLQNLYIAPMSDPVTISGPRVLLSTPNLPWESWIQEGPEVLKRNGMVFLVYAANLSWTDSECLGMLVNTDGNYLNPNSWTKLPNPVFQSYTGPDGSVYGPGHCGFTQSLDGTQDWIFYHAAWSSGSGWDRSIRMQAFSWDANGMPSFGNPVPAGVVMTSPSGDGFTAPRFSQFSLGPGPAIQLTAIAPLPLLTNSWSVETSADLRGWTVLTNVPGQQYSTQVSDQPATSNRMYRIHSVR
jgi:GH43 family beta-xylosidase